MSDWDDLNASDDAVDYVMNKRKTKKKIVIDAGRPDSDTEGIVEEHMTAAKKTKQITDAQRKARLENLRKGRLTRKANMEKKKAEQEAKKNTKSVKLKHYSSSDSDSDSSSEELMLSQKKHRKVREETPPRRSKPDRADEIAELRKIVLKLKNDKKKHKQRHDTVVNVQTVPTPAAKADNSSYSDYYKTRILKI
jgi:hypothetical protein